MREVSWPPGRYAFILSAPSSVMAIAAPRGLSVPALLGSLLGLGLGLGVAGTNAGSSPAVAIPRLDLTPYPAARVLRPSESLKGWGTKIYRVSDVGPLACTRMACPPFVVPYSASRPIVVYALGDLEVRWRLWKAEKQQRPATVL
jgi:ecotin